ncbi:MAG: hypothetical protein M3132_03615 [Actinomycetia bacterium]|nr:hypothetical protein [Actinomycetes bacterium]
MKGKPFLVAISVFVLVLLGGAAIAGVGAGLTNDSEATSSQGSFTSKESPTTTVARIESSTTTHAESATQAPSVKEQPAAKEDKPKGTLTETQPKEAPAKKEPAPAKESEEPKKTDQPAPELKITHPVDGARVENKVVVFGGLVSDGATVHRGKYTAKQGGGEWRIELVLSPGKNRVTFEAISADGQVSRAAVTVYYDAPKEAETEKPAREKETVAFTAFQTYGSCAEEIPYDVFYGTAQPGATVKAQSEYGGNSVVANENGKWEMKVEFPEAPSEKPFTVTIKASSGGSHQFSFTNTRTPAKGE